jgi:hypothetical protein
MVFAAETQNSVLTYPFAGTLWSTGLLCEPSESEKEIMYLQRFVSPPVIVVPQQVGVAGK